jgi:hypothetical protein
MHFRHWQLWHWGGQSFIGTIDCIVICARGSPSVTYFVTDGTIGTNGKNYSSISI